MKNLIPEIPEQVGLYKQLYQAMQGDIVGQIMRQYKGSHAARILHAKMKGNSLQVLPNILPDLYELCQNVIKKLEFDEQTDFYISGSSEINACAILSTDESQPHIIEINSALFNLMSEDELKFVIGHEIGHLINKDGLINELYYFIYPDQEESEEKIPHFLKKRFDLWGRLAEFSADRYGFLANENIDACVTAIFKMGSGLLLDKMNIRISDLLEHNNRSLDFYLAEHLCAGGSHPINPARIRALHLFATHKTKKALTEGFADIMEVVEGFYYDEIDELIATFFASAGLFMRKDRGKPAKQEEDFILERMADYVFTPVRLYKTVAKNDYLALMHSCMDSILKKDPNCLGEIVRFLIDFTFIDNRVEPEELNRIFAVASDLEIDHELMLKAITDKIRLDFKPQAALME